MNTNLRKPAVKRSNAAATKTDLFWKDLAAELEDPEFLRTYIVESVRIATIDRIINSLDDARLEAGMSKAALARTINVDPSVVRRLFSSPEASPTLGTLAEVAAALGMRVVLEPLHKDERKLISAPLVEGWTLNREAVARKASEMRSSCRDRITVK